MSFKTYLPANTSPIPSFTADFATPVAPSIDPVIVDGGLNYLALFDTTKIIVHCGPVYDAQVGDTIEVYWKGPLETQARRVGTLPIDNVDITVSIDVAIDHVRQAGEGLSTVYYEVIPPVGPSNKSYELAVNIKTSVPGDPHYDPNNESGTPFINEALPAPQVEPNPIYKDDLPAGATIIIPPWTYMAVGDVLTLNWGGTPFKQPPLEAGGVDVAVTLTLSPEQIEAGGNSSALSVRYEIRDIVNNWSLRSQATSVEVDTDLSLLNEPYVVDEADGQLDYDSLAGADAQVTVDTTQSAISVGDTLTLHWLGTNAQNAPVSKDYEQVVTTKTSKFKYEVPNVDVALFIGGDVTVFYTVQPQGGGSPLPSKRVFFSVLGNPLQLAPPQLLDGLVGSTFDPGTLPGTGARILIKTYGGMAEGDRIILSWVGQTGEGLPLIGSEDQTLELGDVGDDFEFIVDKSKFLPLGDATTLTFSYTVIYSGGGTRTSQEVAYTVKNLASVLLARPEVEEATADDTLDPSAPLFSRANVQIPDSDRLLTGDRVDMVWESPVTGGDTDDYISIRTNGKGVTFQVPKAIVEASLRNEVLVSYTVSRGGSKLYDSRVLMLFIGTADDRLLPPPTLTEALNGVLDPGAVSDIAHVVIKATDVNVQANDQVILNWVGSGVSGSYTATEDISGGEAGMDVLFDVGKQYVDANLNGTLSVDYTVVRGDGKRQASKPLNLDVQHFIGPQITVIKDSNGAAIPNGGTTAMPNILIYGTAHPSLKVRVIIRGTVLDQFADANGNWAVGIDTYLGQIPIQALGMYGNYPESNIWTITRVAGLTIPTTPVYLNGVSVKVNWTRTGQDAPGNTDHTHIASGGTPPYVYRSNNGAVAVDQNSGKVYGWYNGSAAITVTDATGQTASYPVYVTNIWRINYTLGTGGNTYANWVSWLNARPTYRSLTYAIASLASEYATPYSGIGQDWVLHMATYSACGGNPWVDVFTRNGVFCKSPNDWYEGIWLEPYNGAASLAEDGFSLSMPVEDEPKNKP